MPISGSPHLTGLLSLLSRFDERCMARWAVSLVDTIAAGGRLLVAGNGGSAAEAQHLTAELVGRFQTERVPLPAMALHADTSTVTALGNDYGFEAVFARQVRAHGRPGDILLVLSTSGKSANLVAAVAAATDLGMTTWALTGPAPNPLARQVTDFVAMESPSMANVQEGHLIAIHLLAAGVDDLLATRAGARREAAGAAVPAVRREGPIRLAVIGDSLLDEDVEGVTERISPEAPVVVVSDVVKARRPGGAALAAVLAAREGHDVSLVTAFAEDEAGRHLAERLRACGVRLVNLGGGRVATKTRIRAQGRTLLMLDGSTEPEPHGAWCPAATAAVTGSQAVLVSDYGRGLTSDPAFRAAIAEVAGRTPVVWDPHPKGAAPVPGITVATPNRREASHFAAAVRSGREIDHARHLVSVWGVGYVGVTLGDKGLVLVGDALSAPLAVPAPVASAGDSLGAGDKFAGALAAGLAGGLLVTEAVSRAVGIASRFVAETVQGGRSDTVRRYPGEQRPSEDHRQVVAETRAAGGTIVATAGCFDLLHRGHVALLEQARLLGDCLVVLVNSDDSVRRLKGDPRPVVGERDRASVLRALACVDAVAIFDDDTPERSLAELRPDVYVKGGDYSIEQLPERVTIEACGGRVVLVPYLDGRSTSALIDKTRSGSKPALQ